MSIILRPYQDDLYDQARALIASGASSILIQAPTGSGKTVLVAKMLKTSAERGYRSWFNVHRRELVKQSVMTLTDGAEVPVGIVAAGFPATRDEPIQVCSIQTLRRRRHLLARPQLIIWDECHHTAAETWKQVHQEHPDAVHIGLTATPQRLDGTGLKPFFKELIVGPSIARLIHDGWLSPYRLFAPQAPNLEGVHTIAGDYNKRELSAAMKKSSVTGDVLTHYLRYCRGKRMVLFAWSIEASKAIAAQFNAAGVCAEHVDGDTDDHTRDAAMENFRSGRTLVLTNVDLFGEGVDVPAIEAVALLRPTKSLALYLQQVGRALRPSPGKNEAIILDHAGNCRMHGLPDDNRTWSLEGKRKSNVTDAAPIKQCPMCYAVLSIAVDVCRHCGFKFPVSPREIEQIDGELVEIMETEARKEHRLREQSQARTLEDLVKIGRLRGYKHPEKWAQHLWNARIARRAGDHARQWAQENLVV